ncbi:hypothetical protein COV20_01440 [Candidatus Woesearchaeota archaeon CG10_big_fil_rev_8_21_14_0_10_45_16]|nr:MAG: hypothetical protein COV20_01440 [Candidatus Woesearchaeota archaeon CG10_big_fil_rev_8_21_14_0_10_45_16]
MGKTTLGKALEKIDYKDGGAYLFISGSKQHDAVTVAILKDQTKRLGHNGIYVSLNKGYEFISKNLRDSGCDPSHLYFIDCVTMSQRKVVDRDCCAFISNPSMLTSLSLAITTAIKTRQFDFLFFDSINSLAVYNKLPTTKRFLHYLIGKLREAGVKGLLFCIKEEEIDGLIPIISHFCDATIDLRS